jgi:hypothetical protein
VGADLLFGNPEFAAGLAPWGLACDDLDGDGDLTLGATLDTDSEADGASWVDPVETRVTTPVAGFVSIYEGPITTAAPTGWCFIAQQVDISAPAASVGDPLVLVFRLDASRLPASIPPGATRIFKSGLLVPGCPSGGWT